MAIGIEQLATYLRGTIELLENTSHYEWGNSGACNCGHLAQVMTGFDKAEIHRWALERNGDWSETAQEYCESSGLPIDQVIQIMLSKGLQLEDIQHIEYLSHPDVLRRIPGRRSLSHNLKQDVILYFQAWSRLLDQEYKPGQNWRSTKMVKRDQAEIYDSIPETALGK